MLMICATHSLAQVDSTKKLNQIIIKGYYNSEPLLRSTSAVSILDSSAIQHQAGVSLVGLINTVAGMRMEERSPGSYRLSLRGSLLRSPFGVRNIKIYVDDFPLTDAGGNSYLNLIDAKALTQLEIYKGPEASIFGANTGGAVLIGTAINPLNEINLSADAGSFGLFHQNASIHQNMGNYHFNITEGYQRSNGYRENSALERKYLQTNHRYQYSKKGILKAFLFYSDLGYETPGGLTLAQYQTNPKLSRLATATLPSALAQQAAIYNKTLFGGLSHSYAFNPNFRHVLAIFGSYTDFKNPFITNYEKRWENNLGLRTFVEYDQTAGETHLKIQGGVETAQASATIKNFDNALGNATSLQAEDDLTANQTFGFLRTNFDINKKLLLELGASVNFYNYQYQSYFPTAIAEKRKNFTAVVMPKLALSYLLDSVFTIRTSVSKGYSPPTIAEVRSSDQIINNSLQAESGWNYEAGLRFETKNKRLFVDATTFYFNLKDAIVRRLNAADAEYFVNAGGTKQFGIELQADYWLLRNPSGILTSLKSGNSFTYSDFRFSNFRNAGADFSGNELTGVPKQSVVSSLSFDFQKSFYLFAQYNYVSTLPLNDANSAYASRYHLADLKLGKENIKIYQTRLGLSVGINNLFNQAYSLGNDLNAVGGRYYNAAATRNYYAGVSLKL